MGAIRNAADRQVEQDVVVAKNRSHLNVYMGLVLVFFQKYQLLRAKEAKISLRDGTFEQFLVDSILIHSISSNLPEHLLGGLVLVHFQKY